ncbi:MAG: glycosyltransferase family 2 protein [Candidatus Nanoarchaeia archaeon]|nr:glycosyltransferase family 2 protein [Candidatus Nanoarchaeia archaeon]MDD5499842.1 glycosyltransferase family 2 protein [Candidatus Nanoarchaeia archaeon]
MISVIITAYNESKTIGKCIKSIASQKIKEPYELLIIAPDKETLDSAKKANPKARLIKDNAIGKWNALNMGFKKAKGRILILCDGDNYLDKDSINLIIDSFDNEEVGISGGKVLSTNKNKNLMGYWSKLLADAAHKEKLKRRKNKNFIDCSGNLIGLRAGIISELPADLLSEDAYMSKYVWNKGFDTEYVPKAKVYAKYPDNFSDWIKQKRRSAGGYPQLNKYFKKTPKMRSFLIEAIKGPFYAISYAKNLRELFWSLILFPARLYLWILIFYDKLTKKKFKQVWKRVESTK